MKIIGVIPARLQSTRLKEKVLRLIAGKPMIQHVYERAKRSKFLNDVIIACDDEKILKTVEGFGGKAVMTRIDHPSGSDRIAEVVQNLDVDIVINIQGDEPLIDYQVIDSLADVLLKDKTAQMATVIKRFKVGEDVANPNVVKVIVDSDHDALYFSRSVIPYNRDGRNDITYYKHLGLYAYRKDFLLKFTKMPKSSLELAESLEQLRVIQSGVRIKTIETNFESVGVDTEEDLKKVENIISKELIG
jgi:3-deoxy-manno-octulosonate cytidylyltransferase (CMP-KDO synthetase)